MQGLETLDLGLGSTGLVLVPRRTSFCSRVAEFYNYITASAMRQDEILVGGDLGEERC